MKNLIVIDRNILEIELHDQKSLLGTILRTSFSAEEVFKAAREPKPFEYSDLYITYEDYLKSLKK